MSDEIPFDPDLYGGAEGYLLALHQLQTGPDPAAALTVFRYLRDKLSSGEWLDPAVLDSYLLPALDRIIGSANPSNEVARAFGFKGDSDSWRSCGSPPRASRSMKPANWFLEAAHKMTVERLTGDHAPAAKSLGGLRGMELEKALARMSPLRLKPG